MDHEKAITFGSRRAVGVNRLASQMGVGETAHRHGVGATLI